MQKRKNNFSQSSQGPQRKNIIYALRAENIKFVIVKFSVTAVSGGELFFKFLHEVNKNVFLRVLCDLCERQVLALVSAADPQIGPSLCPLCALRELIPCFHHCS